MDDQKNHIHEERQLLQDSDLARNLLKQERHSLEDLHDAQEAEARALERFRRVQSKLQRRKARVLRLENRLALIRKEIAVLQANLNTPEQQNGHVSTPPDAPASDLIPTSDADEVISPAPIETSPEPADAVSVMSRPDTFEPEPYVTPVFVPPSEPAVIDVPQPTHTEEAQPEQEQPSLQEDTVASHEVGEIRADEAMQVGDDTQPQPQANEAVAVVINVTSDEESIFNETNRSLLEQLAHEMSTDQVALSPASEDAAASEEDSKPIEVSTPSPQPATPTKSPGQILIEARETWRAAEAGAQQARNRAHDLAASISILAQTDLSGTLMEELLRKQSEANKALSESQRVARAAYEQLVQAEEADRLAQQEEQSHTNGLASTTTDDGIEATVQMHAIHLYKEW